MDDYRTLLVDNGSVHPPATLQLRKVAAELARAIGTPVDPASLLHSDSIDPAQIEGRPAEILETAFDRLLALGHQRFVVVPLFFGPSLALVRDLPDRTARLGLKHPKLRLRVASPLFAPDDNRLAKILVERSRASWPDPARIVVVDHGSPSREVTQVRVAVAAQVRALTGASAVVAAASMERRDGDEFAFNEPLLARLLAQDGWNSGDVVVALQFLLPGRHAGPHGDVARICRHAEGRHPGLRTHTTAPMADHPLAIEILADRWRSAIENG